MDSVPPVGCSVIGEVSSNAQPVAGAHLVLRLLDADGPRSPHVDWSFTFGETDSSGRFMIDGVVPGNYRFSVNANGFLPGARLITLTRSYLPLNIDFQLAPGGYLLCGRVVDVRGGPVPGGRLLVDIDATGSRAEASLVSGGVMADVSGGYRMSLPIGHYRLLIEAAGHVRRQSWVEVRGDSTRDFQVLPAGRLAGQVIERGLRRPVAGAAVRLEGGLGRLVSSEVTTSDDGRFEFSQLGPGTYDIHASTTGLAGRVEVPVIVGLGQAVTDVSVKLDPGLALEGRLTDDRGSPISDAEVSLDADGSGLRVRARTRSSAGGAFRLEGLEPGEAVLLARAPGYAETHRPVVIRKRTRPLELVLSRTGRLTGTVLAASGRPLADARVYAVPNPGDRAGPVGPVLTGSDGTFQIEDVPASMIRPRAEHATEGQVLDEGLALAAGESRMVTLQFRGGHRISGRLRWPDGNPAAGVRVGARSLAGFFESSSNADGAYSLGPFETASTWTVEPLQAGAAEVERRVVTVGDRDATGVDFIVQPDDQQIVGRVTDRDGVGIPGADVWCSPGGEWVFADQEGRFVIGRLTRGAYTVAAEAPGAPRVDVRDVSAGTRDLQLVVLPGGDLAGGIAEVTGQAVTHVRLDVLRVEASGHRERVRSVLICDPRGVFEVRGLAPGTYDLDASSPEGLVGGLGGLSLRHGQALRGLGIIMSPGARVIGRLLTADGDVPMAGASVMAGGHARALHGTFDSNGGFEIVGLRPGARVPLVFEAPAYQRKTLTVALGGGQVLDLGVVRLAPGPRDEHGRVGIVVGFAQDGSVMVSDAVEGAPAALAGVQPGDLITHVDGHELQGLDYMDVQHFLRGKPGSTVDLQIRRGQERLSLTVRRL